jgi:hypothetical protein
MMLISCRCRRLLPPFLVSLLATVALPGCGTRMYPVEGKLLWQDGSPVTELAGGLVVFENPDAGVSSRGEIQGDGTFQLMTQRPGDGTFRVLITEPGLYDSDRVPPPKANPKYHTFQTSGLEFTVEPKSNEAVFKLEKAPPRKPRR